MNLLAKIVNQILPVLEANSEQEVVLSAMKIWNDYKPMHKAWFLQLSYDGRKLQVIAEYTDDLGGEFKPVAKTYSFNCDDFDQPFSHVAFNAKSLQLHNLQKAQNMDDIQYQAWITGTNDQTQLLVEPLLINGKLQGLWAIQSTAFDLDESEDVQALKALVCMQIQRIKTNKNQQVSQRDLISSLNSINQDIQQKEQKQLLEKSIIGNSPQMQKLQQQVVVAARSQLNVMVHGETGVGKELVAKAIHNLSDRKNQPFIAINCAAIPDSLLESELFGFVKGSFSGASHSSTGLLGQADKGVFFLDEIGDMPLNIQAKLLRVLETRRYRQLGGTNELHSNFRLIAATHKDLQQLIKNQEFRSDLYYRLNSFPIQVAPLRERKADLKLLSAHFITQFNRNNNRQISGISTAALSTLMAQDFAGNIRQLKNMIEYACVYCFDGEQIQSIDASSFENNSEINTPIPSADTTLNETEDFKQAVQSFEIQLITQRLAKCQGNKTLAAQTLGIPRRTFTSICQRLELNKSGS